VTREEKAKEVAWLHEQFDGVTSLVLADYQGLKVSQMDALRSELRSRGISFKVLKNTLARLAYKDTDVAVLADDVVGPRAAAWTRDEETVPAMAKLLADFAKGNPKFELIRGVLKGKAIDPAQIETLSTLPSREELLGKLLGTFVAPMTSFVGVLAAVPRSFLLVLKAIEEKKSAAADAS
jgi:large subunit ribosomal protein L10